MERVPEGSDLDAGQVRAALQSGDPRLRTEALRRARMSPEIEEIVAGALADPVGEVRRAAVRALGRIAGERAGGTLVRVASSDPSPEVRAEAVAILGRLLRAGSGQA